MTKLSGMKYVLLCLIIGLFGCSTDDDEQSSSSSFYSGIDTAATITDLTGIWAIFSAEFQGVLVDIPIDYQDCGRNFFIYSENGTYTEYLFQSSDCSYNVNQLDWDLNNGIITISNSFGQSDEFAITRINENEFSFKSRIDVDEDGQLDILIINAKRYQPIEIDLVSPTFYRNANAGYENLLSFTWEPYQGFNEFDRIEIYRSFGENCSKTNAVLIETITDSSTIEFTDLSPPAEEVLCYYIKVFTNEGLLGESYLFQQHTEFINPIPVNMNQPVVMNDQIQLSWDMSTMPYFSHYEIIFANHTGGYGSGYQEYPVTVINDRNTTLFIDENPPYLENPVYNIIVHDIFGNKTNFYYPNVTTFWEVPYKRDELTNFQRIQSMVIDPDEPVIYFFGNESGQNYNTSIQRFNYESNQTEAISDLEPAASSNVPIKLISSTNGKELVIAAGFELFVYNAYTMEFKYQINPAEISSIDDFIYTTTGLWVLIDDDDIFTYNRDNSNFFLVNSAPHFSENQGAYNYQVFELNDNKLVVGHKNEPNSKLFDIAANGTITFAQNVDIPITDDGYFFNKTLFNSSQNYLVNLDENRLYSTISFSFQESFEEPYFATGISQDGNKIFGSNNDPDWQITPESLHAKKAIILTRGMQTLETIETIGYPQVIFENYIGEIISVSSGLKKRGLDQNINDKGDIFIETVSFQ